MPVRSHPIAAWEKVVAAVVAVVIVGVVLFLVIRNQKPDKDLFALIRIVLSLAIAALGATIPGFLNVKIEKSQSLSLRAGGALALFLLTYIFTPSVVSIQSSEPTAAEINVEIKPVSITPKPPAPLRVEAIGRLELPKNENTKFIEIVNAFVNAIPAAQIREGIEERVDLTIDGSYLSTRIALDANVRFRYDIQKQTDGWYTRFAPSAPMDLENAFKKTAGPDPRSHPQDEFISVKLSHPDGFRDVAYVSIIKQENGEYMFTPSATKKATAVFLARKIRVILNPPSTRGTVDSAVTSVSYDFWKELNESLKKDSRFELSGHSAEEYELKRQELLKLPMSSVKSEILSRYEVDFILTPVFVPVFPSE